MERRAAAFVAPAAAALLLLLLLQPAAAANYVPVVWGQNTLGQGSIPDGYGLSNGNVTTVFANGATNCVINANGTGDLFCWGNNGNGQTNIPAGLGAVTSGACGYFHTW
jgi:hypothetical protein